MATRASKPFTRRGIAFASQYAYRQFLAAEKGYASPAARNKAIAEAKKVVTRYPGNLTKPQQGVLAAGIADNRHRIGSFIEGIEPAKRGSSLLPPELNSLIRDMGPDAYPIWRTLYV